ncbi:MAG: hypothetical protein ACI83Q_000297 [Colwellia polaris]|jgi:hypothetical protein
MGYGKLAKGMSEEQAKRKLESVMPIQNNAKKFNGSTPPSVFIGSHNYPKPSTGVLSPQHQGDSMLMDSPDKWYSEKYSIEKVASLRTSLVNSKKQTRVKQTDQFVDTAREIAMACKPTHVEVELDKKPFNSISAGRVKPVSASGNLKQFKLGENPSVDKQVEKAFYDKEFQAESAMQKLYSKGVDNYTIQQVMSTGMLGKEENRKLVPTRWSITATDDTISSQILDDVKQFQELGQIEYYKNSYIGNNFHIFLIPGKWEYELLELKRPDSAWNAMKNTYIANNYEGFSGRTEYAEQTAGAYYATKLGIMEHLQQRKRQAKAIVLREVTPDYWAPLGVWVIRETVRNAFNNPEELENMEQVKWRINSNFRFLFKRIKKRSKMLDRRQSSLESYLSTSSTSSNSSRFNT